MLSNLFSKLKAMFTDQPEPESIDEALDEFEPRLQFTDEELSRILTAHAEGGLVPYGGGHGSGLACINQVAFNVDDIVVASHRNPSAAAWFDMDYDPKCSTDELLAQLIYEGFVEDPS